MTADGMVTATQRRWLRQMRGSAGQTQLICFPHAGAGPSAYHAWGAPLAPLARVSAVQLPGREERIAEPGHRRIGPLLDDLVPVLAESLTGRYAFFGHSMGALVAYEAARRLRELGVPAPVRLFVSGHAAPQLPDRRPPIAGLADDEFTTAVRRLNGIPAEVAADRSLMELLLPVLRTDFELCESYAHVDGPPLDCPISALGGAADDVWHSELLAWRERGGAGFRLRMLPGDHFFLATAREQVLAAVRADLTLS